MKTADERLTRKQKRILRQLGQHERVKKSLQEQINFELKVIEPLTKNQKRAFESFESGLQHLVLHGVAGTGKSFISLYLALKELMGTNQNQYQKVMIMRSVVPTRDMGFLPGGFKDKQKVFEAPYHAIFQELYGRSDAYDYFKRKGLIEFCTTSFIRGITLSNCILCCDEIQNMSGHEVDSVITRVGENCKIMFSGDATQSDLIKTSEKNGIIDFMKVLRKMPSFDIIEFGVDDIVRSGLVRQYLIAKIEEGL